VENVSTSIAGGTLVEPKAERANESATCALKIDYFSAQELADEVRAFAMIESGEREHQLGDGGRAFGLLQMHPATFRRYYGMQMRFAPHVADTWTKAYIKACAAFLSMRGWRNASQAERDLIVQAWNLGEKAVFAEGRRNPEYLTRWLEAYDKVKKVLSPGQVEGRERATIQPQR
jgi:hypothetical protein